MANFNDGVLAKLQKLKGGPAPKPTPVKPVTTKPTTQPVKQPAAQPVAPVSFNDAVAEKAKKIAALPAPAPKKPIVQQIKDLKREDFRRGGKVDNAVKKGLGTAYDATFKFLVGNTAPKLADDTAVKPLPKELLNAKFTGSGKLKLPKPIEEYSAEDQQAIKDAETSMKEQGQAFAAGATLLLFLQSGAAGKAKVPSKLLSRVPAALRPATRVATNAAAGGVENAAINEVLSRKEGHVPTAKERAAAFGVGAAFTGAGALFHRGEYAQSVLQRIDDNGKKTFYVIPDSELAAVEANLNQVGANKVKGARLSLSAKTPEQMKKAGFKFGGEALGSDIPVKNPVVTQPTVSTPVVPVETKPAEVVSEPTPLPEAAPAPKVQPKSETPVELPPATKDDVIRAIDILTDPKANEAQHVAAIEILQNEAKRVGKTLDDYLPDALDLVQPKKPAVETTKPVEINPTKVEEPAAPAPTEAKPVSTRKPVALTQAEKEKIRFKDQPEKIVLNEDVPVGSEFKGIPPENIVHFNQGTYPRVTLIVSSLDKEIMGAAKIGSRTRESVVQRIMRERGMDEGQANAYITDRSRALKEIAKVNREKNNPVLLNTIGKPESELLARHEASKVPAEPVREATKTTKPEEKAKSVEPKQPEKSAPKAETKKQNYEKQKESESRKSGGTNPADKERIQTEGKKVKSKAYEKALKSLGKLEGRLPENAYYNRFNLKEGREAALDFVDQNRAKAKRIVAGLGRVPEGMSEGQIRLAYEQLMRAEGNSVEAANAFNRNRQFFGRTGQELVTARGIINEFSPETYLKELLDRRKNTAAKSQTQFEADGTVTKVPNRKYVKRVEKGVAELKRVLDPKQLKIKSAQDIIDSITC